MKWYAVIFVLLLLLSGCSQEFLTCQSNCQRNMTAQEACPVAGCSLQEENHINEVCSEQCKN